MIHFSVTKEQAQQIMRCLIHADCCENAKDLNENPSRPVFELLARRLASGVAASDLRQIESASTNLEETGTKGGIELCQRIS